jgi:nicotinate-nucleotide adenylyltransferase
VETDINGPSYTVDTLSALKKQYGDDTDLYFIMGWDSLEEMPQWKKPQEIMKLCRVVAFTRNMVSPPAAKELDKMITGLAEKLILIDIPPIDISSTDIRRRLRQGFSIHGMVPQKVEDYIISHGLYK